MRCELICDEVFKRALAGGAYVFLGKARAAIVAGLHGEIISAAAQRASRVPFLEAFDARGGGHAQGGGVPAGQVMARDAGDHGAVVAAEFRRGEDGPEVRAGGERLPQARVRRDAAAGHHGRKPSVVGRVEQGAQENVNRGFLEGGRYVLACRLRVLAHAERL